MWPLTSILTNTDRQYLLMSIGKPKAYEFADEHRILAYFYILWGLVDLGAILQDKHRFRSR